MFKQKKLPQEHKMVSFDVKSFFKNVPLDCTSDITLKRIYENKEIVISITKTEVNNTLTLSTKNVQFTFEFIKYVQTDGVAMGSPLGPVLADIFRNEADKIWKRYVNDKFIL